MKISRDGWIEAEPRYVDVDPADIHDLTDEEKVQGLIRCGYPKEKAEAIVKAGKWEETVAKDYHDLAVDPIGWMHEKEKRSYFYMTDSSQVDDMNAELPDPDPGEDFSRRPDVYKPGYKAKKD